MPLEQGDSRQEDGKHFDLVSQRIRKKMLSRKKILTRQKNLDLQKIEQILSHKGPAKKPCLAKKIETRKNYINKSCITKDPQKKR